MTDKIMEIRGDYVQSGIYPSLPQKEPPLWADGQNVQFTERSAQPMPGQAVLIPAPQASPVIGIVEQSIEGLQTIVWGTNSRLYLWDPVQGVNLLGTGFDAEYWTGFRWGDWTVMCPWGSGEVQIYKPEVPSLGDLGGRGGLFNRARFAMAYREFALFFAPDGDETAIRWSALNDVEQYVPALTNAAGKLNVREAEGPIVAAISYKEQIFFFTNASMFMLRVLDPPAYFGYTKVLNSAGVFGPWAVAEGGDGYLYGFGPSGLWRSDTQQINPVDTPAVHQTIYDELNFEQRAKALVYNDVQAKHVFFNYPKGSDTNNSLAKAYNFVDRNWAPSSQKRTCASDKGIFSTPLLGDVDGNIWTQLIGDSPSGIAQDPMLELTESGTIRTGFGRGGFGRGGFGGRSFF